MPTSDDVDYSKKPNYKVPTKDKGIYDQDLGEETDEKGKKYRYSGLVDSEGQVVTGMFKDKPRATATPTKSNPPMNYFKEDDGKK